MPALAAQMKIGFNTEVSDVEQEFYAGLAAFRERDNEQAAKLWMNAATKATSVADALKIADGLSALGAAFRRSGKTDKEVERLFERALSLRQSFLPENDKSIAIELNNLGMLYELQKKQDRFIEFLERAVAVLDHHDELDEHRYAMPYDNLAEALFERKRDLSRAADLCTRALEIRDKILGEINPLAVSTLELLTDIKIELNPNARATRETKKEFKRRLNLLAAELENRGDPLLMAALLVLRDVSASEAKMMITTSLNLACQEFLEAEPVSDSVLTLSPTIERPSVAARNAHEEQRQTLMSQVGFSEGDMERHGSVPKAQSSEKVGPCPRCVFVEHHNKDGSFAAMMDYEHDRPSFMRHLAPLIDMLVNDEFEEGLGLRIKNRRSKQYMKTGLSLLGFPDVAAVFEKDAKAAKHLLQSRIDRLVDWDIDTANCGDRKKDKINKAISAWKMHAANLS